MQEKLPKGVYKARNCYQVRYKNKYIGTYRTLDGAITAREKEEKDDPIVYPEKIDRSSEYIEYAISRVSSSYYVRIVSNGASTHIGAYKDLNVARIARNNALRSMGIKVSLSAKGIELIPDDLRRQPLSKKSAFDKLNAKEVNAKRKPLPHQNIVIGKQAYEVKKKPSFLPPTIEFKPDPTLPDLTGIERKDGVFFLEDRWVVFITKNGIQHLFVATSPEDGKGIQKRGGPLRLREGKA